MPRAQPRHHGQISDFRERSPAPPALPPTRCSTLGCPRTMHCSFQSRGVHLADLATFCCSQVRRRHAATGVSVSTTEKQSTGRMYACCLLREIGKGDDFDTWAKDVVAQGTDETDAYKGVGELLQQLLKKVPSANPRRMCLATLSIFKVPGTMRISASAQHSIKPTR